MILNPVPVHFHLFLYQYLIYWLPVLIRKKNLGNLFTVTAQSVEMTAVQANHRRCSSPESTLSPVSLSEYSLHDS